MQKPPVDFSGRHPLGEERGDGGPRAHAHVDVEARARKIKPEKIVERRQAADLVEGAGHAAAGQAEGDFSAFRGGRNHSGLPG